MGSSTECAGDVCGMVNSSVADTLVGSGTAARLFFSTAEFCALKRYGNSGCGCITPHDSGEIAKWHVNTETEVTKPRSERAEKLDDTS